MNKSNCFVLRNWYPNDARRIFDFSVARTHPIFLYLYLNHPAKTLRISEAAVRSKGVSLEMSVRGVCSRERYAYTRIQVKYINASQLLLYNYRLFLETLGCCCCVRVAAFIIFVQRSVWRDVFVVHDVKYNMYILYTHIVAVVRVYSTHVYPVIFHSDKHANTPPPFETLRDR
jgi:hypothetical protein